MTDTSRSAIAAVRHALKLITPLSRIGFSDRRPSDTISGVTVLTELPPGDDEQLTLALAAFAQGRRGRRLTPVIDDSNIADLNRPGAHQSLQLSRGGSSPAASCIRTAAVNFAHAKTRRAICGSSDLSGARGSAA